MILDAPLFPERHWIDDRVRAEAEETPLGGTAGMYPLRRGTIFALEQWVGGGTFHPYACLTHIEEHEREAYLEQLVIGVA